MKKVAILAAALAIAGCGETTDEAEETEAPAEEVAEAAGMEITPGLYAVGDETTEYGQTRLNADGTYEDLADGEVVGTGAWATDGETMCFDPDGDGEEQQERCWTNGPADEDGSFISTRDDDSMTYRVTPIAE